MRTTFLEGWCLFHFLPQDGADASAGEGSGIVKPKELFASRPPDRRPVPAVSEEEKPKDKEVVLSTDKSDDEDKADVIESMDFTITNLKRERKPTERLDIGPDPKMARRNQGADKKEKKVTDKPKKEGQGRGPNGERIKYARSQKCARLSRGEEMLAAAGAALIDYS